MKAAVDERLMRETGQPTVVPRPFEAALPVVLAVVAATVYAVISLYRHNHFGSNAFDLGVQDQTVWGYSQLRMIPNTVAMIPNLLGDHFHPILMTIAPLYWIWSDARVLLLVQAALLAAAGIPIFWWAHRQLGRWPAILFMSAYLIFWGVLSGVVFDFHHIAFAVPAVSFALYAVLTRNDRLLWAMLALGLLTRENVALTFAAIGIYILLVQRRWRLGLLVAGVCTAWFAVIIKVVIPALGGSPYRHWTYDALGPGPGAALLQIFRRPIYAIALLFDNPIKLRLWGGLVGAWLFLPVFSPLFLVAIPTMLERLWSSNPLLWTASFDYSLVIAPILAFAAIDTLRRLQSLVRDGLSGMERTVVSAAVVLAGAILTFGIAQPLADLRLAVSAQEATSIASCLEVIPASLSVSASSALLPHLSHRDTIYLVATSTDVDFVAINLITDLQQYPAAAGPLRSTIARLQASGYGVACSRGSTIVLHRGATDTSSLSPELAAFMAGGSVSRP
jgi:uncharacterized membrane protein